MGSSKGTGRRKLGLWPLESLRSFTNYFVNLSGSEFRGLLFMPVVEVQAGRSVSDNTSAGCLKELPRAPAGERRSCASSAPPTVWKGREQALQPHAESISSGYQSARAGSSPVPLSRMMGRAKGRCSGRALQFQSPTLPTSCTVKQCCSPWSFRNMFRLS